MDIEESEYENALGKESYSDFYVDSIECPTPLLLDNGILRCEALLKTSDATEAATQIIKTAEKQAYEILEHAEIHAASLAANIESETLQQANLLIQGLNELYSEFLQSIVAISSDIAHAAFTQLTTDFSAREKVEFAIKRILKEAPPKLHNAVLRVNPDDLPLLPTVSWDVKSDPEVKAGKCILEASNGEWCVDFAAAVSSLKNALEKLSD